MPAGQPSKFGKLTDIERRCMQMLYEKGATDKEVADALCVTKRTIDNWKKDNPEFFHSLKNWKIKADAEIERSLFEKAKGGYVTKTVKVTKTKKGIDDSEIETVETKEHAPDSTAMIFWLKNRQPAKWRDKQEHIIEDGGLKDMTDEQLEAHLEKLKENAKSKGE